MTVNTLKKTLGLVIFGFSLLPFPIMGLLAVPSTAETTLRMTQSTGDSKTAIPGSNCREVNVSTLQIWDEPGENVIGELQQGQQVYIANEGRGGWVPIELPGSGYVNSASLRLCSNIAASAEEGYFIPVEACRSIATEQVTVRNRPGGEVIATLAKGQSVQIANEGSEGWVPLVYPLEGYITSANLADCAQ